MINTITVSTRRKIRMNRPVPTANRRAPVRLRLRRWETAPTGRSGSTGEADPEGLDADVCCWGTVTSGSSCMAGSCVEVRACCRCEDRPHIDALDLRLYSLRAEAQAPRPI